MNGGPWDNPILDTCHTTPTTALLHEMVHQWQHENGMPPDHGAEFWRKCRDVGAAPSAKPAVC